MPLPRAGLSFRLKHYHRPALLRVRHQHDLPHKEYFQNHSPYPSPETSRPEVPGTERPLPQRLLRSMLWAGLFGVLGFAYIEVQKAARWVDKSQRDTRREEADMQEIRRKFEGDPLVQILESDPAWESAAYNADPATDPHPLVQHVDPFMSKAVGGSRGIQMVCL